MSVIIWFVLVIVGYLLGTIQTSYILGKLTKGIDIREHGSHNAGASNATLILGKKVGLITAIVDILKAMLPVILVIHVFELGLELGFFIGLMVIIGHVFPFQLKFKGGKGVASYVGIMLGYHPGLGLITIISIICFAFLTDYISLGSLFMMIATFVILLMINSPLGVLIIDSVAIGLSVYKHMPNYIRIINRNEVGLRHGIKKS